MIAYTIKRILLMIPTLIGITLVTFFLIRLAPGDPVAFAPGGTGSADGGDSSATDRERHILKAKVRLGLMQEGGTLRLWTIANGEPRKLIAGDLAEVRCLAASETEIYGGLRNGRLRTWDLAGRENTSVEAHSLAINAIAIAANGRVATASDDKTAALWRATSAGLERELTLEGHDKGVSAVRLHPTRALAATSSRDKRIILWDTQQGTAVRTLERHFMEVTSLAFLGEKQLVSGSRDRTILVWDIDSGESVRELKAHRSAVRSLALSPDGTRLAAGLDNNRTAIYDTQSWKLLRELSGHTARVRGVEFDNAGSHVISASDDKSVRVWNVESGECVQVLSGHTGAVNALAVSPGGILASGALEITEVPIATAYFTWLSKLARLDLGRSFKDGRPVKDRLAEAIPISLQLQLTSIFITYLIAVPIGVFGAARRGKLFDQVSSFGLFLLYSMPSFWVATMLILLCGSPNGFTARNFGFTLPFVNLHSENSDQLPYLAYQGDFYLHFILPLVASAYASFAFMSRLVRTGMLEVLRQDYVRTARAKGLPPSRVVGHHALRNSLIPVVTVFGNILPTLIGGSVIIENIFSIPGMGQLAFDAILQRDYPVVMAVTTLVAVLTMLGILLSDILYCIVDPRIQLQ